MEIARHLANLNSQGLVECIYRENLDRCLKQRDKRTRVLIEQDYGQRVSPVKKPRWVHTTGGIGLIDEWTCTPCVLFPLYKQPHMVLQDGRQVAYRVPAHALAEQPLLIPDVLFRVFLNLDGDSLLTCRLVCSSWKGIIEEPSIWKDKLSLVDPIQKVWNHLPPFQQYVQHTFQGIRPDYPLARFFLKSPSHFAHIFQCEFKMDKPYEYPRYIPEIFRLAVFTRNRRYWIPLDEDIICSNVVYDIVQLLSDYKRNISI